MTFVNTSLYSVKAVLVVDVDGKKVLGKYYTLPPSADAGTINDQKAFEKSLFEKSKKSSTNEIMILDGNVIVYKNNVDLFFYVVGSLDENELVLSQVLSGFYETVSAIVKGQVDKRGFCDNLDVILLALDEIVDNGIILELESSVITQRLVKKGGDMGDIPLSFDEESVSRAINKARDFARNFLR